MQELGRFPFGRLSTFRESRVPTGSNTAAFVLGVYPSAFHVRWMLPHWGDWERPFVKALAVDVEPVVFWDGIEPPRTAEAWIRSLDVPFVVGDEFPAWGHIQEAPAGSNGSSGE